MGADFDIVEWDDLPYVEDGEVDALDPAQVQPGSGTDKGKKTKKLLQDELQAELLKEVTDWVDQYVLEISVDPMASSAGQSVRKGLRKLNLTTDSSTTTATTSSSTTTSPKK